MRKITEELMWAIGMEWHSADYVSVFFVYIGGEFLMKTEYLEIMDNIIKYVWSLAYAFSVR